MTLHPHVFLAEGVVIPEKAWELYGDVLKDGYPNHCVIIRAFPVHENGELGIRLHVCPLDDELPLEYRES